MTAVTDCPPLVLVPQPLYCLFSASGFLSSIVYTPSLFMPFVSTMPSPDVVFHLSRFEQFLASFTFYGELTAAHSLLDTDDVVFDAVVSRIQEEWSQCWKVVC